METVFRARYVFPVDRPPIEDGAVAIEYGWSADAGLIRAVGRFPGEWGAKDLGDVAIVPGFVNAHTHLEFSARETPLGKPGMSLPWWIREVIQHRRQTVENWQKLQPEIELDRPAQRIGLDESSRCGVATVGEIATNIDQQVEALINVANFLELRAFHKSDIESCLAGAARFCQGRGTGLSPHAPYTVHQELLEGAIGLANQSKKAIAMHLAESREEIQFLATSRGPFRDLLDERGLWEKGAIRLGSRPLDYLQALSRVAHSLVVHGNYLDEKEILFVGQNSDRMSVVYCPRTHEYFGHEPYPLRTMLDHGVRVALGTDSRASNPDLDLRKEMQFVVEKYGISPEQALRMGTIEGAAALGMGYSCGTITNGRYADLAIIQLLNRRAADPHELLFDPEARVVSTICRGRVVFSEHPALTCS
jgi:cytosine/adenosine deaminase-related metal-dependent hydrolase